MALGGVDPLLIAVAAPFVAAVAAPFLARILHHNAAWLLAIVPALIFYHFTGYVADVSAGQRFAIGTDWIPTYSVRFSFYIDGLSTLFAMLISGIGAFIVLYSGGYLKGHPDLGRFFSFILLFMGSMMGVVLADNLITLFIFWELTSITSFLLIGFNHKSERSRRAAIQALVVTGGGGLVLLAGLLLLSYVSGQTEMSAILQQGNFLKDSDWYLPILILILGGAFTKSAQFPFHFWLPNAMEAPTPVSAYLHSATMVKAGVYLLMRVHPIFGDTAIWSTILPLFGGATLLVGTILAVRQTDMKLMLAYTTVASLGLLVMLTGISTEKAIEGAVLYLLAHSLFKGALFMVVGTIDHGTGTRDVTKVGGLWRAMPLTFTFAFLASWSMAGLPPAIGFIAKEILYEGTWVADQWHNVLITAVAVVGNALMFVIAFAVAFKPFLGAKVETPKTAHEGSPLLWLGPAALSVCGLVAAIMAHTTGELFIRPMASAIANHPLDTDLHLVPTQWKAPVNLSITTVVLGIVIYLNLDRVRKLIAGILTSIGWGPDQGFDQAIRGIVRLSAFVTGKIQFGRMEGYMTVTIAVMVLTLFVPLYAFNEWPTMPEMPDFAFYEWSIFAIAVVGLIAVLMAANGLVAIVSLGIQGFAVALIFMLFGAPDLSFTQFMVETLSVVILALVMTRLNLAPRDHRRRSQKILDGFLAITGGSVLGLTLMAVTQVQFNDELSVFFNEYSRVIAHGRNVVNVILVDFRGVDTLGEIAVVMVTGLAVLALIRITTPKAVEEETEKADVIKTPIPEQKEGVAS
ncbi:MAG: putative monovalent cation/H+ antiporter subunit A [Stappiaceae bacterium]